jgi:pimeloyl-ACP methyl ester carboxylesterase
MPISSSEQNITIAGSGLHVKTIQVTEPGIAGSTIVFLHDSLGCTTLWRDFPERLALAAGCNAMIYDRKGYGQSSAMSTEKRNQDYMETEAEVLIALLAACNIEQPILFGHSDGGTIALLAAAKYPDRIKAVLTEGAHVLVEDITLEGILMAKEQYRTTELKQRLERYHGDKTQTLFEAWTETWLSDGYRNWNIEHFLPSILCPVMVIQGVEDEYGTIEQVRSITSNISGPSAAHMITNAGHSPHKQSEIFLIEICVAFLEKQGILPGSYTS